MVIRKDTFLLDNYQSDKKGEFRIENIVGKDTLVIDILANDKKGKPISDIVLNEPSKPKFYRPFSKNIFQITDNQSITKEKLNYDYDFDIDKSIILDEVSVKAKPRDTTQVMRMHKFFGKPTFGFSYKQLNFNGKFHYIQAIQGRVPGLNINFDAATGKIYLSWTRQGVPPPAVWVDGMAMKDINDAGFLTNDMIARIDVYRSSVIVPSTNTGLISIFTKTFIAGSELELVDTPPADGMRRFKMKGFYTPKKFYLPDNQNDSNKMTLLENRSTIYWNPEITTNHKGEAKLSFRAIAKEGKYRIELVGFNENGEIMKIEKGFWIGQ